MKPANLFIAEVGGRTTVKVLDFGIAKVLTETASLTKAYEATGRSLQAFTPRYGAPEQFSRRYGATGPWTDVFALALVFVEVVCGHSVLEGDDAAQLFVARQLTAAIALPFARTASTCRTRSKAVIARALEVDLKERYRSAGEFWEALIGAATAHCGLPSTQAVDDEPAGPGLPAQSRRAPVRSLAALCDSGAAFRLRLPPNPLASTARRKRSR